MANKGPLRVLMFDGGNPGKAAVSQLTILAELISRLEFQSDPEGVGVEEPLLTDFFDVIGGSGIGGFLAILATVFKMPVQEMTSLYLQLYKNLFTLPTWDGPNIDEEANSRKMVEILQSKLPQDKLGSFFTWKRGMEKMFPTLLCFVNPNRVTHPRILSTCRTRERYVPCTVLDALRICLSDGVHLPAVPLDNPPEFFIGAAHRFSNPILHSLKQIQSIFGDSQVLSCIVSIGTGDDTVLSVHDVGKIVVDCRWEADHWQSRCSNLDRFFYRFNLTSDIVRQGDLTQIKTDTSQYLFEAEPSSRLDVFARHAIARDSVVEIEQLVSLGEKDAGNRLVKEVHEHQLDQKAMNIREWLSPSDPTNRELVSIREAREPGTGQWFLESETFTTWLAGSSPLFILEGIPGAGKTYFAQLVHDHLHKILKESRIVAYFIKSGQTLPDKQILASILSQTFATMNDIPPNIQALFQQTTYPELTDLKSGLQEKSTDLPLFIVLDALDEFETDSRATLISMLRGLGPQIRIFVTSRPLPAEVYASDVSHRFYLEESNNEDLCMYIHERLGREPCLRKVLKEIPGLQARILRTVMGRCAQMFLLANLHMNQISECRTILEIGEVLDTLPTTVITTYEEAMRRIKKLRKKDRCRATHALMLIFQRQSRHSGLYPRLFTLKELLTLVAASSADIVGHRIETAQVGSDILLNLCAGLLVVTNDHVSFVHLTAYEFFQTKKHTIFGKDPHSIYATAYLRFLLADWLPGEIECDLYKEYAEECCFHCNFAQMKPVSLLKLFCANGSLFSLCSCDSSGQDTLNPLHFMASIGVPALINDLLSIYPINSRDIRNRTALHFASKMGHQDVVQLLLSTNKIDLNSQDNTGCTPLFYAASNGYRKVVELLLSTNQVDPDSHHYCGRTPLSYAAGNGHRKVVELLLSTNKVDLNSQDNTRRTPLSYASRSGWEEVVQLLLSWDPLAVDPESRDCDGHTPLALAACMGHKEVVQLLLSTNKVDPDSRNNVGHTPLTRAAAEGHKEVVQLLLSTNKVDPNSQTDDGQTPLSDAAYKGHVKIVQLLLSTNQVDPNSQTDHGETPLSYAASNGYRKVVELLLSTNKVDLNSQTDDGQTPLSYAASNGQRKVVELLLSTNKVDPDSHNNCGRTPLSYAAGNGHRKVVELLLSTNKVDLNSQDNTRRTPLSYASRSGSEEVVQLLLSWDPLAVDPESRDCDGHTPLALAACMGHKEVVQLLLSTNKVDPDSRNNVGHTPLTRAAAEGHKEVVQLLLSTNKVDPDSQDMAGHTPLANAAREGHKEVVQLLLSTNHVDPDSRDNDGHTPLALAAYMGYKEVVQLLLSTNKVDPDSRNNVGHTPLATAASNGHQEVVQLLLSTNKVDPDSQDMAGHTPLATAASNGHQEVVQLLLSTNNVDPESRDCDGHTPLALAACMGHKEDSQDMAGHTPLATAASNGHQEVVQLLLSTNNVDPESRDHGWRTPLFHAARLGQQKVVELFLFTYKVDPDSQDTTGDTPLFCAARRGHRKVVELLLSTNKVDPDSRDSQGCTPLMCSVMSFNATTDSLAASQHLKVMELLVTQWNADINARGNDGRTVLSYVKEHPSSQFGTRMIKWLEEELGATL